MVEAQLTIWDVHLATAFQATARAIELSSDLVGGETVKAGSHFEKWPD
jgi:hypothetical protein